MSKGGEDRVRVVAVAGAKGGVGKSLLAANLGVFLATLGKRVLLVDAAFGCATLHQFLGVARPARTLADMMGNSTVALDHVAVDTGVTGLRIVAGEGDPAWAANPKSAQLNRLIARLRQVDADYVILDLAAGTTGRTLDLFLIADIGIVVTVPEPTSVELVYRWLRAAFVRRLRKIGMGAATEIAAEDLRSFEGGIPSPVDIRERVAEEDPGAAERIASEMTRLQPHMVVSQARSKADIALCGQLARAIQRRFGIPAAALGHLEYDDVVAVSVRRRRPLLVEHPESRIAHTMERLTRRLLSHDTTEVPVVAPVGDSYYDLLEIDPTSTEEEIRRGARSIRAIYARDSIVMCGLYNKARLDDMHLRLDEAYETLMDPVSRKAYDHALFPGGVPHRPRADSAELADGPNERAAGGRGERGEAGAVDGAVAGHDGAPARSLPPPPELPADVEFTGELMRQVRESAGVALRQIAEHTKIGMGYLRAIEAEAFDKLPAVVYVRGFLVQYARVLGLDEERLLDTYLARYRATKARADTHDG